MKMILGTPLEKMTKTTQNRLKIPKFFTNFNSGFKKIYKFLYFMLQLNVFMPEVGIFRPKIFLADDKFLL